MQHGIDNIKVLSVQRELCWNCQDDGFCRGLTKAENRNQADGVFYAGFVLMQYLISISARMKHANNICTNTLIPWKSRPNFEIREISPHLGCMESQSSLSQCDYVICSKYGK